LNNIVDNVLCSECKTLIDESSNITLAQRKPCPQCGSLARIFNASIQETLIIREKIGLKLKRPGNKKPIYESVSGDDLFRATGQWNKLTREIDRENDLYKELIINGETGEVIRDCQEPLTEHVNRGSDKSSIDKSK
jgi:hypothetical protein